jgi:hypothetical protein
MTMATLTAKAATSGTVYHSHNHESFVQSRVANMAFAPSRGFARGLRNRSREEQWLRVSNVPGTARARA